MNRSIYCVVFACTLFVASSSISSDSCTSLTSCSECALQQDCGWCNDECWDLNRREECLRQHEMDIIDETPGCNDNDPITAIGFDANEELEYEMHIITCETVEEDYQNSTNCDEQIIVTTVWVKTADIDKMTFEVFAKLDEISTIGNNEEKEQEYLTRDTTEKWPPCNIHIRYGYISTISCPEIDTVIEEEEEDNTLNANSRRRNMDLDEDIDAFYDESIFKRRTIEKESGDNDFDFNDKDDRYDFSEIDAAMNSTKNISITRIMKEVFLNQFRELLPRTDSTLYDRNTANVSERDPNGRVTYKRAAYQYNQTDVNGNNKSKVILTKSNDLHDYESWDHSLKPTELITGDIQEIDESSKHVKRSSFTEHVSLKSSRSSDVYDVENTKPPPSSYNAITMDIELLSVDIVSDEYITYLQELYEYSLQNFKFEASYYTLEEWRAARTEDDGIKQDFEFNKDNTHLEIENVEEFFEAERESRRRRLSEGSSKYEITDRFYLLGPYEYVLVNQNLFGLNFKSTLTLEAGIGIDWDNEDDRPGWQHSILCRKKTKYDKCPNDIIEIDGIGASHYKIDEINACCNKWKYNYCMCSKSKRNTDDEFINCIDNYISNDAVKEVKDFLDSVTQGFFPRFSGGKALYLASKLKNCELDFPELDDPEDTLSPFFMTAAADLRINNHKIISFGISYNYLADKTDDETSLGYPPICIPVFWGISICFTIEVYFNYGMNPQFGTENDYDIYFGVAPFAAAGAGAYGYIDAIIVRAGVFLRGDLIRIEVPAKATWVNGLFVLAPWQENKDDRQDYIKYSIDFNYITAVITAGLYYQYRYIDCGCKCSWGGCSCWCGFKWSGRKTVPGYTFRYVLGGSSSTNIYTSHDGVQKGDPINRVIIAAQVYSKHRLQVNESQFYYLLNAIDLNSGEYDEDAYQFILDFKYNRNNITTPRRRRRLLQTTTSPTTPTGIPSIAPTGIPSISPTDRYPGYDYISELSLDLVVFSDNEADHITNSINQDALHDMDIFSDSMIDIVTNAQSSEAFVYPTPHPSPSPTPSPTDERYSTIEVQCDNEVQVYYSQDGVTNFELVLNGTQEITYFRRLIDKPCDESKLLFKCSYNIQNDIYNNNGEGGFIANIEFNNFTYPTNMVLYPNYFKILNTSSNDTDPNMNATDIEIIELEQNIQSMKQENISNNESKWIWIDIDDHDEPLTIFYEFSYRVTDADPCPLQDCQQFDWIKRDINWNKIGQNFPETDYLLDVDTKTGSLSINVELDYVGFSWAGYYKSEYGFGTTYVLDFESFNAEYSKITEPGSCSNRMGESFENRPFEDWWIYSHSPYGVGHLGSDKYLAYPPPSDYWDIYSSDEYNEFSNIGCNKFVYSATFRWNDLLQCRNYHNNISYIQIITDDIWINMSGTFYVNLVSPISNEFNLAAYHVYQLISVPFIIAIKKFVHLLSSNGIALYQMTFISVYKEDKGNNLRLILLTQSADYLMLDDIYLYGYPDNLNLYNSSWYLPDPELDNTSFIDNQCINSKNGVCLQIWEIQLDKVTCPTNLTGDYIFSFTTLCNPHSNNDDKLYCKSWKENNPKYDIIRMDTPLIWNDEMCDKEEFLINFDGKIEFFVDSDYLISNPENGLYLISVDRIYVEVTAIFPSDTVSFYNIQLNNVWLCSTDYLDKLSIDSQTDVTNSGCFSNNIDSDKGYAPYYIISNGEITNNSLTKEMIDIVGGENRVRFSFIAPDTITRDTIYVHVQLTVLIEQLISDDNTNNNTNNTKRRRRILLQNNEIKTEITTNHFGNNVGITSDSKLNFKHSKKYIVLIQHDNNNNNILLPLMSGLLLFIISVGLAIIYYFLYQSEQKKKTQISLINNNKEFETENMNDTDSDTQIDDDDNLNDNDIA